MRFLSYSLIGSCVAIVIACSASKSNVASRQFNDSSHQNYMKYCAGCHGAQMEAFRNRTYKYGSDQAAIYTSIQQGIEKAGMPSYAKTFSDAELKDLVAFIKTESTRPLAKKDSKDIYQSEVVKLKIDTITTQVNVPWAMEFLDDNSMLITDRDGDFYHRYEDGRMVNIQHNLPIHAHGQGGLLDVLIHPDFAINQYIYLSYSKSVRKDNRQMSTTAIVRARLKNDSLTVIQELFEARPYFETNHHYGSRLLMDANRFLYFSVGERGKENINPQDLTSECGKIHRLHEDGTVPIDNPYIGNMQAAPSIYSYGHRNPQGMDFHPTNGVIWANEHGPKGGDEVNIIQPKANYGWPMTTFGINYNGTVITENTSLPGITDPIHFWVPSIGPGDATFVTSDLYGTWKGDYMVTSLSFGFLNRCIVKDNKILRNEKLLEGIGRMRSVKQGKDGFIYIGLENPGRIFRIRPLW